MHIYTYKQNIYIYTYKHIQIYIINIHMCTSIIYTFIHINTYIFTHINIHMCTNITYTFIHTNIYIIYVLYKCTHVHTIYKNTCTHKHKHA